jgi:hypothetical protein
MGVVSLKSGDIYGPLKQIMVTFWISAQDRCGWFSCKPRHGEKAPDVYCEIPITILNLVVKRKSQVSCQM